MTEYTRINYNLNGPHTFWSREEDVQMLETGGVVAKNIETGSMKYITPATPLVLTEGVELPAKVRENAETVKA